MERTKGSRPMITVGDHTRRTKVRADVEGEGDDESLGAETVQSASGALEGVDNVKGCDGLTVRGTKTGQRLIQQSRI